MARAAPWLGREDLVRGAVGAAWPRAAGDHVDPASVRHGGEAVARRGHRRVIAPAARVGIVGLDLAERAGRSLPAEDEDPAPQHRGRDAAAGRRERRPRAPGVPGRLVDLVRVEVARVAPVYPPADDVELA